MADASIESEEADGAAAIGRGTLGSIFPEGREGTAFVGRLAITEVAARDTASDADETRVRGPGAIATGVLRALTAPAAVVLTVLI